MHDEMSQRQVDCLEYLKNWYGGEGRAFNGHMIAGGGFDWMQLEALERRGHIELLSLGTKANDHWYRLK